MCGRDEAGAAADPRELVEPARLVAQWADAVDRLPDELRDELDELRHIALRHAEAEADALAQARVTRERDHAVDQLDQLALSWEMSAASHGLGIPHRMTYGTCARQLRELLDRLGLARERRSPVR